MADFDYERLRADVRERPGDFETTSWPLSAVLALIDGHEAGATFGDLAKDVFAGAFTRNALIGKARRIGLPERGAGSAWANERALRTVKALRAVKRPAAPPRPPKPPKPILEALRREAAALTGTAPVLISALTRRQCKWPVGDPKAPDFAFCGRERVEGRPYCLPHAALAVDPQANKRARRSKIEHYEHLAGGVLKRAA